MLQLDYVYTRYAHRRGRTPYLSGFVFVVLLHAIIISVLVNALHDVKKPAVTPPLDFRVIPPDFDDPSLPSPPIPILESPPPVDTPIIQEVLIAPIEVPRSTIAEPVAPPPLPAEGGAVIVSNTPPRAIERTQTGPAYPAISRRLAEEGSVRLRLTIGVDGSVISASVISSSGFHRLDDAAARWVRRNWRYQPAMRGNMPVEATTEATLTFRLE
nr:MAG: energy transducer TonB [Hyphomicrobiales bacterium]